MKIRTWIKYEESYLPPRCRKLRYKECEEHVDINLREIRMEEMKLAFEDNSYSGKGKIYSYKNKLWSKVKTPNPSIIEGLDIETPLDYLKWCNDNCSSYFCFAFDREYHDADTSRQAVIEKARTADAATHCRRFFLLPAPKYWAVIIEKPFVSPIEKPTMRKVSEDIFPTAAS